MASKNYLNLEVLKLLQNIFQTLKFLSGFQKKRKKRKQLEKYVPMLLSKNELFCLRQINKNQILMQTN